MNFNSMDRWNAAPLHEQFSPFTTPKRKADDIIHKTNNKCETVRKYTFPTTIPQNRRVCRLFFTCLNEILIKTMLLSMENETTRKTNKLFVKKQTRDDKMRLQPKIKNHIIINKRVYLKWCTHSSGCEWKSRVD